MRFYRATLENVGINGPLSQKTYTVELCGFFSEDIDKLLADDFALLFRIGYAGQLVQKAVNSVDVDQVGVHLTAENIDDLLGLSFAEKTVVDMYANQLFSHGAYEKRGHHRGVHAAAECQQNLLVTDLGAQSVGLFGDERLSLSGRGDARHRFGSYIILHYSLLFRRAYLIV